MNISILFSTALAQNRYINQTRSHREKIPVKPANPAKNGAATCPPLTSPENLTRRSLHSLYQFPRFHSSLAQRMRGAVFVKNVV